MLLQKSITGKMEVRGVNTPLTSYYITLHGGFPLSSRDNKLFKINRIFEIAAVTDKNKKIIIDCIEEPMLFISRDHLKKTNNGTSWFEFLHQLSNTFNFPEENIVFLTSNIYAVDSYNKWCAKNNIDKKIQVVDQPKHLWLERLFLNGCNFTEQIEDKHVSMFLGRPTIHRNLVMSWFLKDIIDNERSKKMATTFFYKDFSLSDNWDLTDEEKKCFTKNLKVLKNNSSVPTKWLGETDNFKNLFSSCLFNFTVDYHEAENFQNYNDYREFKSKNDWWREDVISEKLFRTFIYKRPFIRLGMPNSLKVLHSWGFKTFDNVLFDESYDNIDNCFERTKHILSQVTKYLDMPFQQLKDKIYSDEVQEIINHNFELAYKIYNNKEKIINV